VGLLLLDDLIAWENKLVIWFEGVRIFSAIGFDLFRVFGKWWVLDILMVLNIEMFEMGFVWDELWGGVGSRVHFLFFNF
jgi:hypothetical protein